MEGIAHLVSSSLARHGFTTQVDHRRLQWSPWLRCESSFSLSLVPSKPGLFMLAEEPGADQGLISGHRFSDALTITPVARLAAEGTPLTPFQISQVEDLSTSMARLLLPTVPVPKARYVRYAVLEDEDQRRSSHRALLEWMASCPESKNEVPNNLTVHTFTKEEQNLEDAENALPQARTGTSG
jgi:hypothetical protein